MCNKYKSEAHLYFAKAINIIMNLHKIKWQQQIKMQQHGWWCQLHSVYVTPLLTHLQWLPIEKRITFKMLLIIYKCLNNGVPNYLSELASIYYINPIHKLWSSSLGLLSLPGSTLCGNSRGIFYIEDLLSQQWGLCIVGTVGTCLPFSKVPIILKGLTIFWRHSIFF